VFHRRSGGTRDLTGNDAPASLPLKEFKKLAYFCRVQFTSDDKKSIIKDVYMIYELDIKFKSDILFCNHNFKKSILISIRRLIWVISD